MRVKGIIAIFMLSLVGGLWVGERSWNGQVFVYFGEQRSPAAIRALNEYSSLDHAALYRAAHTQLLANAQVLREDAQVGIELGHPLLSREDGGRQFGCQVKDLSGAFDRIQIVFIGTGVSSSGEAPRMTVDSRCQAQTNLNRLEPVWLPMRDILASAPKDRVIDVPGDFPESVKLESMPDQWPENWVLWSIKLYRADNPDETLELDTNLLRQARPSLLSFDWKIGQ